MKKESPVKVFWLRLMSSFRHLAGLTHRRKKSVRLAIVGETACGKTYLINDVIGSLEKLGYHRDDRYRDATLPNDVYSHTEERNSDGSVDKSDILALRRHDVYLSRFLSSGNDRLMLEFVDIPGEVMVRDSIIMFRAIMEAMMKSTAVFESVRWIQPKTYKKVWTLRKAQQRRHDGEAVSSLRYSLDAQHAMGTPSRLLYESTSLRERRLQEEGYVMCGSKKVNGASVFQHFLDYDTDTVINTIIDCWPLLDIDKGLPPRLLTSRGGQQVFSLEYQLHFFYHYYVFYATDVVVCDKCCTPLLGTEQPATAEAFTNMVEALHHLTSYADAPRKNWHLAIKGMDAVMQEAPFRELFQMSKGDIQLVYSHFVTLFRVACRHDLLDGQPHEGLDTFPFVGDEQMVAWLTSCPNIIETDEQTDLDKARALLQRIHDHYVQLAADPQAFFIPATDYAMAHGGTITDYMRRRVDDFCHLDERLAMRMKESAEDSALLQLPPRVFFIATPIDNDFRKHGHDAADPTSFEGEAKHYVHRADFGTLQMVTSILLRHGLDVDDQHANYGQLLAYTFASDL